MYQKIKLWSLILGVIITGSIQYITIPLFVSMFPSLYFLLILTSVEGIILYTIILIIIVLRNKSNFFSIPEGSYFTIFCIGVTNACMSICFIYSANPVRTPVVVQSIFLGLAIIPSILFTKIILCKQNIYDLKYTIPSLVCLLISIILAIIPMLQKMVDFNFWIFMYFVGVIFLSLTNILQEKYVAIVGDSFENKIKLALYSGLVQIITLGLLCWVDLLFGYNRTAKGAFDAFIDSIIGFQGNLVGILLTQIFIFDCLFLFLISIYLNGISTNYNMILTNLTNQSVALFFTIFPHLNKGIRYPLSITMLSMFCNVMSIILWVKGEGHTTKNNYESI